LQFTAKDEPATLPRVSQLIIITEISPWCTIVKNERGVTMNDVCTAVWKECVYSLTLSVFMLMSGTKSYTENFVTDPEFAALPPRLQEQVKRMAAHNNQSGGPWPGYYATPPVAPNRYKRVGASLFVPAPFHSCSLFFLFHLDWLRERTFFEGLRKSDAYSISRLGYKAPNIFVMDLVA
jgi:hypothetical protein